MLCIINADVVSVVHDSRKYSDLAIGSIDGLYFIGHFKGAHIRRTIASRTNPVARYVAELTAK